MKKRLLSIIIVLLGMVSGALADVTIDENHFPDWHFRSYVKDYCQPDLIDGVLTDSEIAQITEINAVDLNIEDLTGIEYFTELKELDVFGNSLTSIDVSHNTKLERLDCGSNQLTSIDVSKNTVLRMLFCPGNQLTALNVANNPKLAYLDCSNNQIGYAEMKKLVESLPLCQPTTELPLGLFTVLDRDNDQNIITAAQVDIAKAKNWRVVSYSPYGGTHDFSGFVGVPINQDNFPDENFRSWVRSNCDTDSDGFLGFEEIETSGHIYVNDMGITDLKGIEHFTALSQLRCENNQLTSLDLSNNTGLILLQCQNNQLTSLDLSNSTELGFLYCQNNQLNSLDLSNNTALVLLICYNNQLISLDVSNKAALKYLQCYKNRLTSLVVSNNTALTELICYNNQIRGLVMTSLINSLPTVTNGIGTFKVYNPDGTDDNQITIVQVEAAKAKNWRVLTSSDKDFPGIVPGIAIDQTNFPDGNFRSYVSSVAVDKDGDGYLSPKEIAAVTTIDVSNKGIVNLKGIEHFTSMKILTCYGNQLTTLDVSGCTSLTDLECRYNQLTELNVSGCTELKVLDCNNNRLTTLDVKGYTSLIRLNCYDNQLTSLDVSYCNTLMALECFSNQLTELDVSGCSALTELSCYDNQLEYLNGLSDCRALKRLECYKNQIRGDGMTYLVDCLRTIDTSQEDPGWMAVYFEGIDDDNEMMTRHVEAAKDNGWTVQMYDGTEWVDYPGVPFYVEIDEDTFTDPNFRSWVLAQNYGADGVLTEDELDAVTEMDLSGLGIEQLDGIQYFTALKKLVSSNNNISYLWLDNNQQLSELWIDNNEIWGYAIVYLLRDLSDNGGVIRLFSTSATEGNGFTTAQVDALKAKGWRVLTRDGADYAGIDQGVPIIQRNFPDDAFRSMIIRGFDGDLDGYLNQVEIQHTKSFDTYLVSRGIKSLEGIEYFTSLNELKCWINNIDGSFVSLLPVTTDGKLYYFYGEGRDFNTMTPAQVYTANQKGWRVLREDGSDYLGVIVEGDADGNGEVGTQDVERLSDYILGRNSSAFSLKSADLDDNGTVDITDLTLLIEKLKKVKR